jgi:RNA polymerase sigma-70 factor, ECF subfamily
VGKFATAGPSTMTYPPATIASIELLDRAQAGDQEALTALIERYLPRLRRWAGGRLPAHAREMVDTGDVVQDTVIAAVRNIGGIEIRGEGAFQAYLRRALANRLTDLYRRPQLSPRREEPTSQIPALGPSPAEEAIGAEALARYETALNRLSDSDRQAIILRVEMCCDFDEVAAALRKSSAGHARVTVSRALRRLAREMHHARA